MENKKPGSFFVVSAPSGAGKTTLTQAVIKKLQAKYNISKVVTYTSRPPRKNEADKIDYNFVCQEEFLEKEKNGFFLETTKYHNYFYGSPAFVLDEAKKGKSFIIVTDYQGGKNYLKFLPNPILIWIEPPNLRELKKRLIKRNREDLKKIEQRLEMAKEEIETEKIEKIFHHHIVNDNFDDTVLQLYKIVQNHLNRTH